MPFKSFGKNDRDNSLVTQRPGIDIGPVFWVIFSFTVATYMIFAHLGLLPLLDPDEGRNASIAWGMQMSGHWLIPTYNGLPYLDKPSLFFKAVAMSLTLFGHNEFAARLPSALSAIGILTMVFIFCRREYNLRTAALATIIVSTTPLFFAFSRVVIFDMPLAFFVCASIFAGYLAERANGTAQKHWYIICAVTAGVATLVKGPVGFVVPAFVLIIFNLLDKRKGAIRHLLSWKNLLVLLLVVMPWFIGVSVLHPDFPYYGLVREVFLRFTTNAFNRSGPFYYYLPIIFGTFIFWSLLLPETVVILWCRRKMLTTADRLFSVWAGSVIIFFSLSSSKLPGYILTAIIVLGVLTARLFDLAMRQEGKAEKGAVRRGSLYLSMISTVFVLALIGVHMKPEVINPTLRHIHNPAVVITFHSLTFPLIFLFGTITIFGMIGAVYRNTKTVFLSFLVFPLCIPFMILPRIVPILSHRSDRVLAEKISHISQGTEVACFRCFPEGLPFYLKRKITLFTSSNGSEMRSNYIPFYLSKTSMWPPYIKRVKDFKPWLSTLCKPVFLIVKNSQKPQFDTLLGKYLRSIKLLGRDYWGGLLLPQMED